MTPICYKFTSEAIGMAALKAAGLVNEDGLILSSHVHSLDVVGTIYQGGTYSATGDVITPPVALPGWHVNLLHANPPESLDPYLVIVSSAARVFSGWPDQSPDDATLTAIEALA